MALESGCQPKGAARSSTAGAPRAATAFQSQPLGRETIANRVHLSFAFPTQCRIRKSKEYERIYSGGRSLHSKSFLIIVSPSQAGVSRLGITVSRRVDKRAVVRNRIRRRIREIFRLNRHKLNGFFDIVVIARQNAVLCPYAEMQRQILGALRHKGYLSQQQT
jgi:ribonuclease P protein component